MLGWRVLTLIAAVLVTVAVTNVKAQYGEANVPAKPVYVTWGHNSDNDWLNGVYGPCRKHWLWQAQQNQFNVQNTTCPFGPYAALIVNHHIQSVSNFHIDGFDCGKPIEGNSGQRGAFVNPMLHAEIESINRLMDCNLHPENCAPNSNGVLVQTQAQNKTYFNQLSLYSTGESCVMDAAAEAYAGFGEIIYGFPTVDQMAAKWPLSDLTSQEVYDKFRTPTLPLYVIGSVEIERYRPYYSWQYTQADCPAGCVRSSDASTCVKATY